MFHREEDFKFLDGSPAMTFAVAVPLMLLIFRGSFLPARASSVIRVSCPSTRFGAIQFTDLCDQFQLGQVQHVGHRHPRLHLVASRISGTCAPNILALQTSSGVPPPARSWSPGAWSAGARRCSRVSSSITRLRCCLERASWAWACSCRALVSAFHLRQAPLGLLKGKNVPSARRWRSTGRCA